MKHPIVHLDDIELQSWPAGKTLPSEASGRYEAMTGDISARIGARLLGYNLTVITPGRAAYPAHNHHVNEEMFLILSGAGLLRVGAERYPVRAGHVIACPPGNSSTAHQLVNTGVDKLRFLAISTKLSPEFVEYPDSGKFGLLLEKCEEAGTRHSRFVHVGRTCDARPYWEGE